ncbi:MAG: hypothetical protein KJ858_02345, partial [Nanoarchaeota archaeon]|nr:hypothetical protein [Nanoarchaeota archaeon]
MGKIISFNQFVSEHNEKYIHSALRGILLLNLGNIMNAFSIAKETFNKFDQGWNADLINGEEEDFYIIRLSNEEEKEYFFIKEIEKDKKYLVFTYAKQKVLNVFNRLLNKCKWLWKPWLGSRFLENFNSFVKNYLGHYEAKLVEFSMEYREIESKKKKGSSRNWIVRSKEDLTLQRRFNYENFGELHYVKRGKYQIFSNSRVISNLSLSDRGEFSLRNTDLIEFLNLANKIFVYATHLKELFSRRVHIVSETRQIRKDKVMTTKFEKMEIIRLNMKSAFFDNWYENLLKLLDIGYLNEHKIILFGQGSDGNGFIISEVLDIETGNRIFISSNE